MLDTWHFHFHSGSVSRDTKDRKRTVCQDWNTEVKQRRTDETKDELCWRGWDKSSFLLKRLQETKQIRHFELTKRGEKELHPRLELVLCLVVCHARDWSPDKESDSGMRWWTTRNTTDEDRVSDTKRREWGRRCLCCSISCDDDRREYKTYVTKNWSAHDVRNEWEKNEGWGSSYSSMRWLKETEENEKINSLIFVLILVIIAWFFLFFSRQSFLLNWVLNWVIHLLSFPSVLLLSFYFICFSLFHQISQEFCSVLMLHFYI